MLTLIPLPVLGMILFISLIYLPVAYITERNERQI